ncbi:hypothetical protein GCM10020219_005680 [Nonomuraea dietziae]
MTPENLDEASPQPSPLAHRSVRPTSATYGPWEAAERAGHGGDVLLRLYAKCIDGQREVANRRILKALAA